MDFSIITINKNNANGLEKTIQSVLGQTFKGFEYIVIDGDSTDGSKEVLEKYKNKLNIAVSEPDSGIYNAMNKGAKYAHGEYLLFLNSGDELFDKGVLDKVMKLGIKSDLASGVCYNYSADETLFYYPPKNISLYTFIGGSLPHPSTFIKKTLFFLIGGYHEEYKIMSDWCFFIEAAIKHNCSYETIPTIVARYNLFGISTTSHVIEDELSQKWLRDNFGRIIDDYINLEDEALSNCMYWLSNLKGTTKKTCTLPFKILNHFLKLRNRLSKRISIVKQ